MSQEEIISKIQDALKKVCNDFSIEKEKVRVKLSLKKDFIGNSLLVTVMNEKEIIKDIKLGDLLGLNAMELMIVGGFLKNTLSKKASEIQGATDQTIDARICTRTSDFYPSVYLFNSSKYIREITVSELVS